MKTPSRPQTLQAGKQPLYRRRALKDKLAQYFVGIGGISVIAAILLIFFYLLYVVVPMFEAAEIQLDNSYTLPGQGKTLFVGVEELGEVAVRFTDLGEVIFFNTADGSIVYNEQLELPANITSIADFTDRILLGFSNGD